MKSYDEIMEEAQEEARVILAQARLTARAELKSALVELPSTAQRRFITLYGCDGDSLDRAIARISEDRMSAVMQQIRRSLELDACGLNGADDVDEIAANAKLLVAAPEMLAALEFILKTAKVARDGNASVLLELIIERAALTLAEIKAQ